VQVRLRKHDLPHRGHGRWLKLRLRRTIFAGGRSLGSVIPAVGSGTYCPGPDTEGNALLSAVRYEVEKLRCSAWGQVFTAALPAAAGTEKYRARARAVVALGRYYLGVPWYRLEGYQAVVGVPVPDATQWALLEHGGNCASPVFKHFEQLAAQGDVSYQDDPAARVVALIEENRHPEVPARTGRSTTGLIAEVEGRRICVYYAGRPPAGENLAALLRKREPQRDKPLVMSEALASHAADDQTLSRCHGLAHGQRKFRALDADFPGESAVVTQVLRQGCEHDEAARERRLSADERLAYHQTYRGPLLEGLKAWLEQQGSERTVEPNSSLGQAIAYLLKHWTPRTRFLTVPGAP
jgi:transposase